VDQPKSDKDKESPPNEIDKVIDPESISSPRPNDELEEHPE
jgi:hypothetical protein